MAEEDFCVVIKDGVIYHHRPDGNVESVKRSELVAVVIETNDLGIFTTDMFWILMGERGGRPCGCYIPAGATGEDALIKYLQALPGFDHDAMLDASSSVQNARFLVWQDEGKSSSHLMG